MEVNVSSLVHVTPADVCESSEQSLLLASEEGRDRNFSWCQYTLCFKKSSPFLFSL